jgi:hypothetical protein
MRLAGPGIGASIVAKSCKINHGDTQPGVTCAASGLRYVPFPDALEEAPASAERGRAIRRLCSLQIAMPSDMTPQ